MTREVPHFLDEPPSSATHPADTPVVPAQSPPIIGTPVLLDARPDAPEAVGSDWCPPDLEIHRTRYSSTIFAAAGLAILIATWLVLSALASIIHFFSLSAGLGGVALALYVAGSALVMYGVARAWWSLQNLHQVDALRLSLRNPTADLDAARALCRIWLERLTPRHPEAGAVAEALGEVQNLAQLRALARNRLVAPLAAASHRIGMNAATEVSALVALSPHASWDGAIVAVRGFRVIHQVAQQYGLRPGPVVTLALLGRVARAAVETAATDLLSQTAIDHLLGSVPIIKHLAAIPGAGVAGIRLYRLAKVTARACDPMSG